MSTPTPIPHLSPEAGASAARAASAHGNGTAPSHVAGAPLRLASTPNGEAAACTPPPANPVRPDVFEGSITFNRDLSWLEFNKRVLELAIDERTPLLERVRFLGIFSSNLDEFVMKRIGLLHTRVTRGLSGPDQDGLGAPALLSAMRRTIRELQLRQYACYEESIRPALSREGIELVDYQNLTQEERRWIRKWYRKNVFPVLTPLAVDSGHRFPFISNLSRNLGILMTEPGAGSGSELFARVKVPNVLPQWVRLPAAPEEFVSVPPLGSGKVAPTVVGGRGRFVGTRDIIQNNLDDLFPGMNLVEVVPFRVTRDSEQAFETGDDADNLLEMVEQQLKQRRFAHPVRLETGPSPSPKIIGDLVQELGLSATDIDERPGPLDYTTLFEIADIDRPELKWSKWQPVTPARLTDRHQDIFGVIRQGDLLVHHPFESFQASAERFITEASRDPDVLAIKQTIYRTSKDSPFIHALIRAAESGKQVAVLVELRARFDEQSNVRWARLLEKAGAHVAYGVIGYKTHCKAAMVVRRENDGLRTYAHLGTGNYNPRTASLYTDLGLFTCDPATTDDVTELFNFLTGRSRLDTYETLLVAPINMKRRCIDFIRREADLARAHARGESPVGGRIIAKMNALADSEVAEALYAASQAGVEITLLVRGFCCLRPGVPGLSENIRVISVLGRFLEHSRIFHFGAGKADPLDGDWFISSADWMYRNLNNRVESGCPVTGRAARAKLLRIIQVMIADRRGAWELHPDGTYLPRAGSGEEGPDSPAALGTFETLMRESRPQG
ncbi:MAG: polyphosphate kinase 1 [Phycisphaerales bacterium]|nr:polyphosphate kinase 1 [Phycisphaerales bacterium]